jgi:hypothetical protein
MKVHKRTTLRAESTPSSASRYSPVRALTSQAKPLPNLRHAHAPVRLPAQRDSIQPRSRLQAGAEAVAAPLVSSYATKVEMLTHPKPVNAIRDLSIRARLLDAGTKVSVRQSDAVPVAARGIDNLPGRHGTVRVDPVAPSPTKGGGRVGDLLAFAV